MRGVNRIAIYMDKKLRIIFLIAAIIVILGVIYFLELQKTDIPKRTDSSNQESGGLTIIPKEEKEKKYPKAIELEGIKGYINSDNIRIADLIGKKIILVDFWTYSCINCQRTTPYLNSWYERYKNDGLEIIGVHTPEFDFEKIYNNVKKAETNAKIKYPVVLDSDYATWYAYENRYWPHKYLIDIDGYIVYDHIGEGAYNETEKKIQELLEERMKFLGEKGEILKGVATPEGVIEINAKMPRSPEVYFGSSRNESLGNGKKKESGTKNFIEPKKILPETLYLVGKWNITDEYAENIDAGAKIIFRYKGKNVYFVAMAVTPTNIDVRIDGTSIGYWAGRDTGAVGGLSIQESRLYELVNDPNGYGEHTLEIIIDSPGLKAFTFTFG